MKDTFNMGYDLQRAGFDFAAVDKRNGHNMELLNGIAEDFVKASLQKAGIKCNKEEILYRFDEATPALNHADPILILYVNSEVSVEVKFINRSNSLFAKLFVEELVKA